MTRRGPLRWYDTKWGPWPDCAECVEQMLQPMFVEAVYSCAIESGSDPAGLARRVIDHHHANRHREGP